VRKRVAITLLAIVVAGGLVFVCTRPKEGTVEWHKREYARTSNLLQGGTGLAPIKNLAYEVTGIESLVVSKRDPKLQARFETHQEELLKAGFLERRRFEMRNQPVDIVARKARAMAEERIPAERSRMTWMTLHTYMKRPLGANDSLTVVAVREDMPMWEEAIRKADVP
jgi:hypothetical protein